MFGNSAKRIKIDDDRQSQQDDWHQTLKRLHHAVARLQHQNFEFYQQCLHGYQQTADALVALRTELILLERKYSFGHSLFEESHISRLPLEILAIIVSYCCWKTKLFLLATNSFLNRFVAQSILELPFAVSDDSSFQVIRRFTCLKHVTLTGKVSEEGLQYLPSLVQLESLKVEKANYVPQQLLSFLQPLQKLSSLSINFVPHLTTIDVPLTQLTRLELIDQFSIEFPTTTGLENLRELVISECFQLRCNYALFSGLTNLTKLCIDSARDIPTDFNWLSKLTRLTHLEFTPWPESVQVISDTYGLAYLTDLVHLDLKDNIIVECRFLEKLTQLTHLSFWMNIPNEAWEILCSLPHLRSLSLAGSDVQDSDIARLAPLADRLTQLDLASCDLLTNACVDYLTTLTGLRVLNANET